LSQRLQFAVWLGLLVSAFIVLLFGNKLVGIILLLLAQFFPRCRRCKLPAQ
jgi:hypothetical protein